MKYEISFVFFASCLFVWLAMFFVFIATHSFQFFQNFDFSHSNSPLYNLNSLWI
jgi:ABC-type phosphate transport system permease subunit